MSESMWIRSHVERLLQDEWGLCRVQADGDGDYFFRHGTAAGWVSVVDAGDRFMVRVWAHAAHGLKPSLKLYNELNDIQLRMVSGSVALTEFGAVVVSHTVSAEDLRQAVLAQALLAVRNVADDIGLLLAAMFGGSTPFPAESPQSEDAT